MGSTWRKAKLALGLNLCVYVPRTLDDDVSPPSEEPETRFSTAVDGSPAAGGSDFGVLMPTTPVPTSSGLRLSKSGSRSSKVLSFFFSIYLRIFFMEKDGFFSSFITSA